MNVQAIELRPGDTLVSVGKVIEVVRRLGWVNVTVTPEEGTDICFPLPSAILVETDRPIPVRADDPRQPWKIDPTPPKRKVNPTPIPVNPHGKPPKNVKPSAASLRIGAEREARHGISDPGL